MADLRCRQTWMPRSIVLVGALERNRTWNESEAIIMVPVHSLRTPSSGLRGALGFSVLGEKVVDERITISSDPMDPTLELSVIRRVFRGAGVATCFKT